MKKLLLFNDTMGSSFDNKKYLESATSNLKEKKIWLRKRKQW